LKCNLDYQDLANSKELTEYSRVKGSFFEEALGGRRVFILRKGFRKERRGFSESIKMKQHLPIFSKIKLPLNLNSLYSHRFGEIRVPKESNQVLWFIWRKDHFENSIFHSNKTGKKVRILSWFFRILMRQKLNSPSRKVVLRGNQATLIFKLRGCLH